MSRKCSKRCHLFLYWLKDNCSRFPFQPRFVSSGKRGIVFDFEGLTTALRFFFSTRPGYTRISVETMWKGQEWDTLGYFDVGEVCVNDGWMCRLDLPEDRRYWRTKEELCIDHCFEPFGAWCKNQLTSARWLELFTIGPVTSAHLFKELPAANATMLSRFERLFKEEDNEAVVTGQGIILPIRKKCEGSAIVTPVTRLDSQGIQSQSGAIKHHRVPIFFDEVARQ